MTRPLTDDERTINDLFRLVFQIQEIPEALKGEVTPLLIEQDLSASDRTKLRNVLALARVLEERIGSMKTICLAAGDRIKQNEITQK
jgi:hypothetical protein